MKKKQLLNQYNKKRIWKIILLLFALLIGAGSVFYSGFFVRKMQIEEQNQVRLWTNATEKFFDFTGSDEERALVDIVRQGITNPIVVTLEDSTSIFTYINLDSTKTWYKEAKSPHQSYDSLYYVHQLELMKEQHPPFLMKTFGENYLVYYKDSFILRQLKAFPYIQIIVIALFLIVAYFAFNSARKSEQNLVWVGLAKETAHQLGTPISSLMAWLELLKVKYEEDSSQLFDEMEHDIKRLEIVADRFSKIGSTPILEDHNVYLTIQFFVDYFRMRTSDKVKMLVGGDTQVRAMINIPLFDWVIENLLKNAVNAIENEGTISIEVVENLSKDKVIIDVRDSGKGIPRSKFDTVFEPGYTTRKRGWGLGLSLTKRIIDNYHGGSIYVKDSELHKGTTFRIVLNAARSKSKF